MTMISKSTIGICAGVAGVLFVGYCIYFDKKRRNDPNFRRKLRERRRRGAKGASSSANWPNLQDQEAVQKFFLTQVQAGEELLGRGELEEGVAHLSRAVAVCGQPHQLLQVLQNTLPPQVFDMLIAALPNVGASVLEAASDSKPKVTEVTEDDVE